MIAAIRRLPKFDFPAYVSNMLVGAGNIDAIVIGDTEGANTGVQARFCGVVTGQGEGPLYQLQMVGMFDTPKNRAR